MAVWKKLAYTESPTFTGTVTMPAGVIIPDAGTIGLGPGKGLIQFDDEATTDFVSFSNCNVGIGMTSPLSRLVIDINAPAPSMDINAQATGTIAFSDASVDWPGMTGKTTAVDAPGLFIVGATNDTNSRADMELSVRESDSTDYATMTSAAFKFTRYVTDLVTILRSGNVGIGAISPTQKLSVGAEDNSGINIRLGAWTSLGNMYSIGSAVLGHNAIANPDTAEGIKIMTTSAGGYGARAIELNYLSGIVFHANANNVTAGDAFTAEVMRITNIGRLGLGTTAPATTLNVYSAGAAFGGSGVPSHLSVDDSASFAKDNGGAIVFRGIGTGTTVSAYGIVKGGKENATESNNASYLNFWTRASGANLTEKMRIDSAGKVGVGTTTPTRKLDVADDLVHSNSGYYSQLAIRGTADSTQKLNIGYDTTSFYGFIEACDEATAWQNLSLQPGGGNVGIGDTAPGEVLDVAGNINATGVLKIDDVQVVGNQGAHVVDADAGTIVAQFNTLLTRLEAHGLLASAA